MNQLDPQRTIEELKELRQLTGDENGAQRVAFTPTWAKARAWLQAKAESLGAEVERDEAGNLWMREMTFKELYPIGLFACRTLPFYEIRDDFQQFSIGNIGHFLWGWAQNCFNEHARSAAFPCSVKRSCIELLSGRNVK